MKPKSPPAPMLPLMGRPAFGGVHLRPGFTARKPYTGPQLGLFETQEVQDQPALEDMLERAHDEDEYGAQEGTP